MGNTSDLGAPPTLPNGTPIDPANVPIPEDEIDEDDLWVLEGMEDEIQWSYLAQPSKWVPDLGYQIDESSIRNLEWGMQANYRPFLGTGGFVPHESLGYNAVFELELEADMVHLLCEPPVLRSQHERLVFVLHERGQTEAVIERSADALTPAEITKHWKLVEEAIRKEVRSFVDLKTFEKTSKHSALNVMTSKWVLRWKFVDNVKIVKARLTVRGFQDLAAASLDTYAGTASRWSQRIVNSVVANHKWDLKTLDVGTAFLQGVTFAELAEMTGEPIREVSFVPPKGSEKYFQEFDPQLNFSQHVLRMLKPVYGLKDAPRCWRLRLDQTLKATGGKALRCDPAVYVWHDKSGSLSTILSTHVDDLKGGGTPEVWQKVVKALETAFGKLKVQEKKFEHCGLLHEQRDDGTIVIHQSHYSTQLRAIPLSDEDQRNPSKPLNDEQKSSFLTLLGGLSWLVQTRMDIAVYVAALQRQSAAPTVECVSRANKLVKWVKRKTAALTYRPLTGKLRIMVISDAAFKRENDHTGLAMRGAIVGLQEYHEKNPGGTLHVWEFYARKQRRVCRSTFAAELHSLSDAVEMGKLCAIAATELYLPGISAAELSSLERKGQLYFEQEACTDAKSLFDALASKDTKLPLEASLIVVLLQLKESLLSHSLKRLWWTDTRDMTADGLNKGAVGRDALLTLGNSGSWKLLYEAISHSERLHVPIEDRKHPGLGAEEFVDWALTLLSQFTWVD
jgi:hypothetical protein